MIQKNKIIKFIIILAIALVLVPGYLFAGKVRSTPEQSLSKMELEQLLNARTFTSKEELFQLLHILYRQYKGTHLAVRGETMDWLSHEVETLFPLTKCSSIVMQDSLVIFKFIEPQEITLANTWRQASLEFPERLILEISEIPLTDEAEIDVAATADLPEMTAQKGDVARVSFKIREGFIKVDFSFLLRFLGGQLRDVDGSELVYYIDTPNKISRLSLLENNQLNHDQLLLDQSKNTDKSDGYLWLDILHEDFPANRDVGFSEHTISYLGMDVELLPDFMVAFGGDTSRHDPDAWKFFSSVLDKFKQSVESGKYQGQLNYTRSCSYHFEEREMSMTVSIQP